MHPPLVLDFDGSVTGLADARIVSLAHYQESIRFACSVRQLNALAQELERPLHENRGTVFLGSGDFHHVSLPLIARAARRRPIEVVVLDNHPDNMRWIGGIHCGSWVRHVARLVNVRHIHVLGITSADISTKQLWENYFSPLWRGRLTYWSIGQTFSWMHRLTWRAAFNNFTDANALCAAFALTQHKAQHSVYLSIDKDVLTPRLVTCNWDQGCFDAEHVGQILAALSGRIVGSDVTGDLSDYRYEARWKRWLSARDAQPVVNLTSLPQEQAKHQRLNATLALQLDQAMNGTALKG